VPNRKAGQVFGHSFHVTVPSRVTDRATLRRQFEDLPAAKKFASETQQGAVRMGTDSFASSAEERAAFAAVIPELRRRGLSPQDALAVGIMQAVGVRRTLDEVVDELLEIERQCEASDLTLATLAVASLGNLLPSRKA
jgi:hypothetical protein